MSDLRTAAQQVVDEHEAGFVGLSLDKAVAALRAALAEPPAYTNREVMQQALEALEAIREADTAGATPKMVVEARKMYEPTIAALKAALAEQCHCGDRPAAECPGEWEPGCDLGANEAHAKVYEPQEPVAPELEYGGTNFGFTFAGITLTDGDKRLAALLTNALGNDHPAFADLVALFFAARGRAALAEPQEPVAWGMRHSDGRIYDCIAPGEHDREPGRYTVPLYTHPAPQRQPLSDEEIDRVTDVQWAANHNRPVYAAHRAYARAIERAHGIGGQDDTR